MLFAGLTAGHFGLSANHFVIDFVKDFGLILFVFSIGLQVRPRLLLLLQERRAYTKSYGTDNCSSGWSDHFSHSFYYRNVSANAGRCYVWGSNKYSGTWCCAAGSHSDFRKYSGVCYSRK